MPGSWPTHDYNDPENYRRLIDGNLAEFVCGIRHPTIEERLNAFRHGVILCENDVMRARRYPGPIPDDDGAIEPKDLDGRRILDVPADVYRRITHQQQMVDRKINKTLSRMALRKADPSSPKAFELAVKYVVRHMRGRVRTTLEEAVQLAADAWLVNPDILRAKSEEALATGAYPLRRAPKRGPKKYKKPTRGSDA